MATLHGPRVISAQLQVKIPRDLARTLRLEVGDQVYWRVGDDDPGVLTLLPGEVVERRYQAGEELEASSKRRAWSVDDAADR